MLDLCLCKLYNVTVMENALAILLLLALFIIAFFILPRWRMRRAMRQVIDIFLKNNAVHSSTAQTPEQLGFRQNRGLSLSLFRLRDFKKNALNMLIQAQVIQQLEDGRLYLSEEKLSQLRL